VFSKEFGERPHGRQQAAPAVWASGTDDGRQSAIDYAYAAGGTTVRFGKAVTKAFFGKAPSHSYFNGCSNGGRNAYIAAQRWPDEFDGIVAGCETMDMAGQTSGWLRAASFTGTPAALSPAQTGAAYAAALSACDALDGATDNLIGRRHGLGRERRCTLAERTAACPYASIRSTPGTTARAM
jgi:hypothetical protein